MTALAIIAVLLAWAAGYWQGRAYRERPEPLPRPVQPPPNPFEQARRYHERVRVIERTRIVHADNYVMIQSGGRMVEVRYEPVAYPITNTLGAIEMHSGDSLTDRQDIVWKLMPEQDQFDEYSHKELAGHPNYRFINGAWYYKHM